MRDSLITAIIPLKRDPNLRRIDVNGRRVAALRASDVQSLRLRVGLPWTSDLVAEVQQLENSRNAHQKAMNLLGARMYSKAELRERLVRAGFDAPTSQAIIERLEADRWIDDRRFARELVRSLTRSKPASRTLLLSKMRKRKIEPEIAQQTADEVLAQVDSLAEALQLAKGQSNKMKKLSAPVRARRLAGLMARRGFDQDTVADVLDKLGFTHDPMQGTFNDEHSADDV